MIVIKNLLPYEITVDGRTYPAAEKPARCEQRSSRVCNLGGYAWLNEYSYDDVEGVPEWEQCVFYIVDKTLACAMKRKDLLFPDEPIKDESGNVVVYKSLGFVKYY